MSENRKREAAAWALEEVRPGRRLGLGSGSTARHLVELLGEIVGDQFTELGEAFDAQALGEFVVDGGENENLAAHAK